jgi:TM2 domain-containing membrane protein YozV
MENTNENTQDPGHGPSQPQDVPTGVPRREYLRQNGRYKSPVLATLLSLMPGLGQIYVGYYRQGFINVIVIAGLICLLSSWAIGGNLKPFFGFFMAFYWLFNLVDAYRKCTFYNNSMAGLGAFELPDGERLPGGRGSLVGGALLIIAGGIALAYTRFGISLDWIEDWWPLGLILMGAYLIYQPLAYQIKQRKDG